MAAALLPLIAGLAPEIINLIVGLVHPKAIVAQQTNGPGTGPVKFADVFVGVMSDLVKAHAAGTITLLPDETTVKVIIQAVVASMQLVGVLPASAVASTTPPVIPGVTQSIAIGPGQSILITG